MGINILLAEANGKFSNKKSIIENAIKKAEGYAFPNLGINWDIDILVTNYLKNIIIPQDGVGGRTIASDLIEFAVDEKKISGNNISEMVVHELCHAARWGKNNEWANTLFDNIINEGIATCFEIEFAKGRIQKTHFARTVFTRTDAENARILEALQDYLYSSYYDYDTVFFNGNDMIPRWAGYSLGYYLVKKYLDKTGRKIENVFSDKYSNFRKLIDE